MSGNEKYWRIIRQEKDPWPAARNMGLDESILEHVSSGESPPTIRFYMWKPSAISIGYFQGLDMEVDVGSCKEMGVDVVRRITGGGAVYHDNVGELTYSVVVREKQGLVPKDIMGSYRMIIDGLITGLGKMGVEAEFRPLNDIVVSGKKISGNAQTRRKGCILQHGTILLSVDVETMFKLLRIPSEKMKGKLISKVKESVTSLRSELGEWPDPSAVADAMQEGLDISIPGDKAMGRPTEDEISRAGEISGERYSNWEWTSKR